MDEIIKALTDTTITPELSNQILQLIEKHNKFIEPEAFIEDSIAKYDPTSSKYIIAKQLLKNQIEYYSMSNTETTPNIQNITFNSILQFIDTSIILDIFGVQPMSGPVGLNYHTQIKEQDGSNFGTSLSMSVIAIATEACAIKLQAKFSLEAIQDINNTHGIDIANEITRAMGHEVIIELENHALKSLLEVVETYYKLIDASLEQIVVAITETANNIATKSRRGAGNFAVIPHSLFARFLNHPTFVISEEGEFIRDAYLKKDSNFISGFGGKLTNNINIIVYTNDMHLSDQILVGFKGNRETDCGAYFSPYHYLINGGTVLDNDNMQPLMSFVSRFGLTIFEDTPKYYGLIKL